MKPDAKQIITAVSIFIISIAAEYISPALLQAVDNNRVRAKIGIQIQPKTTSPSASVKDSSASATDSSASVTDSSASVTDSSASPKTLLLQPQTLMPQSKALSPLAVKYQEN
ncbi:MAG: hypothetical protein HQK67_04775 [Desulfamplus sp.]|nr:hypothetical protein [Desulfamplus sp.]